MKNLKTLSNKELLNQLKQLVEKEQSLTLKILPHLVEVERRGLYLEKAYSSLYEYFKREFGYTDASAWRRAGAAIAIFKCPEAWKLLHTKRVTMSALCQGSSIITPALLNSICGKTKAEVDLIIAALRPQSANPDRSRPVVVPKKIEPRETPVRSGNLSAKADAPAKSWNSLRGEVNLTNIKLSFEQKWKVEGVVSKRVYEKLERCKKLLSTKYPKGVDYNILFDELTELFLDKTDPERSIKQQMKLVNRPNSETGRSRYIPHAVKIKVWKRDAGKCTFVGSNGKRCNSDYNLQFDHYPIPYARGGPSTVKNLRLLCAKHNKHTAEKTYGKSHMEKFCIKESPGSYVSGARAWIPTGHRLIC
jgi:hypothetical protein